MLTTAGGRFLGPSFSDDASPHIGAGPNGSNLIVGQADDRQQRRAQFRW